MALFSVAHLVDNGSKKVKEDVNKLSCQSNLLLLELKQKLFGKIDSTFYNCEKHAFKMNQFILFSYILLKCNSLATTVLVIIKLTKFAVALRLRCGSCKFIF